MSGGVRFLMGALGVILLLPGLCSVVIMFIFLAGPSADKFTRGTEGLWVLWGITFVVAIAGIFAFRKAIRG